MTRRVGFGNFNHQKKGFAMFEKLKAAVTTATAAILPAKKNAAPVLDDGKKTPRPDEVKTVVLLAWAMPAVNTRLLVAYLPGSDPTNPNNLVSVNVRSNFNFMKHMKLNASFVNNGVYDLVGPLPRWKGRW